MPIPIMLVLDNKRIQSIFVRECRWSLYFYDPENETNLNYLYKMMLEKETFYVKRLSFDDLNDFAENFYEN